MIRMTLDVISDLKSFIYIIFYFLFVFGFTGAILQRIPDKD